jgi:hypothetical protein
MRTLKPSVPWRAGVGVVDGLVWSVASVASVPRKMRVIIRSQLTWGCFLGGCGVLHGMFS